MRVQRDDLFKLFPDLPWAMRPSGEARSRAIDAGVDRWRERAIRNIARQRAAAAEVKKKMERMRREPGSRRVR